MGKLVKVRWGLTSTLVCFFVLCLTLPTFADTKGGGGGNGSGGNGNGNGNKNDKPLHDVLTTQAQKILDEIGNLAVSPDPSDVVTLRNFNNPKVIEVAVWRLIRELKTPSMDMDLIESLVILIHEYALTKDFDQRIIVEKESEIKFAKNLMDEKFMGMDGYEGNLQLKMKRLIVYIMNSKNIQLNKGLLDKNDPNFRAGAGKTILTLKKGFENPEDSLAKFKETLEEKIIEQPEVVEAFYDLEFETAIKGVGNTDNPPFFYLMGLTGVGKDTSAEAYVDALYGMYGRDHLFPVPVQRSAADAWSLLGSATGYVGSDKLSPFIQFLVQHSAGRYMIKTEKGVIKDDVYVIENPDWKPGDVSPNSFAPERAAVFLNEFHDWSAEAKAIVLKESLEKGTFKINNPGKGVAVLRIPGIRFIAASNEGIELVTNRDSDGRRFGEPLNYDEMMSRWQRYHENKDALKQAISKTALKNPPGTPHDQKLGIPEEMLNRIHPSRLILMKPISPEGLQKIARIKIQTVGRQLENSERGAYGSFKISATDALVKFIQEYDYLPEDGARPIGDKVRSLMEYPFYKALREGRFTPNDLKLGITVDVKKNDDKTYTLVLSKGLTAVGATPTGELLREQPISQTFKERENEPISDEKIDSLGKIEENLKNQVFGAEKAIEMISSSLLLSEESRHAKRKKWSDHEKATSFAFLGPSSTGKSEMAKAITREIFPEYGEQRRVDIDFNKVQTEEDLREMIWGRKVGREVQHSEFMKKYDQYDGDILFVFEESSNTPPKLLRSLYDLFRENHPKFADGKDRPMTNVTIIMTGNAGIEWYSEVPKDIPLKVQMAAWQEIYEETMKDPQFQRATLEKYYPEPLINRIGQTNIVWFAPLTFKSVRELTLLKLANNLEKLKESDGRRGWDVGFRNKDEMNKVVEVIEREGYYLYEQGASIDRYVDDQIQKGLRKLLLQNKVPIGAKVAIIPRDDQTEELVQKQEAVFFDVEVDGQPKKLQLKAYAQHRKVEAKEDPNDVISTAAHEAGHELVNKVLLGDKYKSDFITIVPGVTKINDKWEYYAGLASREEIERLRLNYEGAIKAMAGLMAGFEGEKSVSIEGQHSHGKSNDISRATGMAENMILKWGLVPEWGFATDNVETMSDARRQQKENLVKKILEQARGLADQVIANNSKLHFEMTRRLARKGKLEAKDLDSLYAEFGLVDPKPISKSRFEKLTDIFKFRDHNVNIKEELNLKPEELANLNDVVEKQRLEQVAQARVPKKVRVFDDPETAPQSEIKVTQMPKAQLAVDVPVCQALFSR